MGEAIVRDIQNKTQFTLDAFAKEGKYIAPRAPYGYRKSPDYKHKLVVDSEAAYVVRAIFAMACQHTAVNQILRQLNEGQVPPPMQYAIQNGVSGNYAEGNGLWNMRTIQKILANRTYAGDLLQGRNQSLVLDTHEAIISRKQFEEVQRILNGNVAINTKPVETTEANSLRGKVRCACCGGKMQRKRGSGHADWYFFKCLAPQIEDPSGYKRAQYERMVESEITTEEFLQAEERLYCSDERYKNVRDELNGIEREIGRFEHIKSAGVEEVYSTVETVTVASSDRITVEFR